MRRKSALVAAGVLLGGFLGMLGIAHAIDRNPPSSQAPTNGEFLQRFAQSMGLAAKSTSPSQALATLQAARVVGTEPINLDGRLTEGLVATLSQRMQLGVVTSQPDRVFSQSATDNYFSVFGATLAAGSSGNGNGSSAGNGNATSGRNNPDDVDHERNPNAADPRERGRGKKVGLSNHFPF